MRYLYGDSAPFPLQYNFLATLETFIASAARAAQLDAESRAIQDTTADAAVTRAKSIVALEAFHHAAVKTLQGNLSSAADPQIIEYARQVIDHATRIVDESKRTCVALAEREQASSRVEIERRGAEIRQALEQFLLVGRIPVLESRVSLTLADGQNSLAAVFTHPDSLVTSFKLSPAAVPAWQSPRKVSEFATGIDLMIGMKKSIFKRSTQPESVHLDDHVVSGFDLTDDSATIQLRKKITDPRDAYVFTLRRVDTELLAEAQRFSDEAEPAMPVDHGDRVQLERLWQLLRAGVSDVLVHKERLLSVMIDGQSLFEQGHAIPFIERIIRMMAPTISEIAKRSPNMNELSLKMESDGGRREEIYVKKEDLLVRLDALGERERALFAPLSLTRDKWVSDASVQAD